MLSASYDGHQLKPFVLGSSKIPRGYTHTPEILYASNKKAWITENLFKFWLTEFNSQCQATGKKVLLFVDNCPSHIVSDEKKYPYIKQFFA